jgi:phosphoribosylaminoimidazolecarboxamide formyltransferase/IMP cyclohydrolase
VELRYGINPHQAASVDPAEPEAWPIRVVNGAPSYINLLDALSAWQLVSQAAAALDAPAATSFKHVSPAGSAVDGEVDDVMATTWGVDRTDLSPVARAYVRARDCDPKCSFGDFVAVSEPVDASLAAVLGSVVSDGVIAPGFEPGVAAQLARKKAGSYLVIEADPSFVAPRRETRELFGVRLTQDVDDEPVTLALVSDSFDTAPADATARDLVLAMLTARHTQSNSVVYARNGMVLGVGAGQQSRIDCTRLAGTKSDTWWLRRHPRLNSIMFPPDLRRQDRINWIVRLIEGDLTPTEAQTLSDFPDSPAALAPQEKLDWLRRVDGISLASDGYIPFRDNIDEANRHGVGHIADPGGSTRSPEVTAACEEHGIQIGYTGIRLFHH